MVIQRIRSNIKILAVILGSLILIYLSLCVLILPRLLTSKIPELIEQDTGRKALVTKIQIQPFPLVIRVQGFEMQEAGDFYETAKQKLFTIIKPEEDRLKRLASARAQVISNYMVQQGIASERLFILDTVIDPERNTKYISVVMSLNSN